MYSTQFMRHTLCLSTACILLFNHLGKWDFYLKIIFGRKMSTGVSLQLFPKYISRQ
jgi:hypothetical protein